MPGNTWLIVDARRVVAFAAANEPVKVSQRARIGAKENDACAGMISAAATMSKTIAQRSASRGGMPGGAGGLGHRHDHHHRPDQLVFRHRSERAAQRRANSHRRRRDARSRPAGAAGARPARRRDRDRRFRRRRARRYRRPLEGNLHRQRARPIIRRSCACSRGAEPDALRPWRSRRWGRSIARAISASISTRRSSTICRTNSAPAPTARPASSREAYVIAHEVGHHVQDELGILPRVHADAAGVHRARPRRTGCRCASNCRPIASPASGRTSAQQKHNFLDPGDVDQALQTASAIGDDRLQKETQGYVVPDAFTHGTSEQRKRWFSNGFNHGDFGLQYVRGELALVLSRLLVPALGNRKDAPVRRAESGSVL